MRSSSLAALALAPLVFASTVLADAPAIDGDFDDWSAGETVWAEADDLRLRLRLPDAHTLQSAPVSVALHLDMDADPSTGIAKGPGEGIDLTILFSPPYQDRVGNGVNVVVHTDDGAFDLSPSAVDLVFAPTYASRHFELRLDRAAMMPWGAPRAFHNAGTIRWWLMRKTLDGEVVEVWDSGAGEAPAGAAETLSGATLPSAAENALRVASMNVLWASPMISPPPFIRLMNVIDADVWLFQEWDIRERDQPRIPVADIEAWLEDNLTPRSDWTAVAGDQRGVVIASRLPLRPQGPIEVKATAIGDRRAMIERSVRYVAAIVETDGGDLLLGNVHLKCCGGRGGEEDRQRIAEASAVSTALDEAIERSGAKGVILGGDFNLVGSPIPLAILKNGLDPSGVDLAELGPSVLGDDARYTWTEAGSRFPAGRLDYLLYSTSSLSPEGAWILDTARLSAESLSEMGLERGDSAATDHRPIIVDLSWNDED